MVFDFLVDAVDIEDIAKKVAEVLETDWVYIKKDGKMTLNDVYLLILAHQKQY